MITYSLRMRRHHEIIQLCVEEVSTTLTYFLRKKIKNLIIVFHESQPPGRARNDHVPTENVEISQIIRFKK